MTEQELADAIVRHSLELQRYSAHEEAKAAAELKALADDLRTLIGRDTIPGASRRELKALLKEVENAIAGRYINIAGIVDTDALMGHVAERTVAIVSQAVPSMTGIAAVNLSPAAKLFGDTLQSRWAALAGNAAGAVINTVQRGHANGWTTDQIVRSIVGTRSESGLLGQQTRKDGPLVRHVRAEVHTSIMTAANKARLETYRKAFGDVAKGVEWLATLDSRTCVRCANRDGSVWDFGGKQIVGKPKLPFEAPALHHNCRCSLTAYIPGITTGGTRASMNGPVKDMSFDAWFKRQPADWREEWFARQGKKSVAEEYAEGKLTLSDLITRSGQPKTLADLGVN